MIIAIIMFILIFKSIIAYCPCFIFITDVPLKDSVYILYREVVIVVAGMIIFESLAYYNVINIELDNAIGIMYCVSVAVAIWTILGFILVLTA
jgi:hypothetical protein